MKKIFATVAGLATAGNMIVTAPAEAAPSRYIDVQVSQRGTTEKRSVHVDCNTLVPLADGKVGRRLAFPAQFNLEASEAEISRYQNMNAPQKQAYLNAMTPAAKIAFQATASLPAATRAQYNAARSDMRIVNSEALFNMHNAIIGHVTVAHGVQMSEINGAVEQCKPWLFNH